MQPDDFNALEMAQCAKINFEAVAKQNPGLRNHPIWLMAMAQVDALIAGLEAADA